MYVRVSRGDSQKSFREEFQPTVKNRVEQKVLDDFTLPPIDTLDFIRIVCQENGYGDEYAGIWRPMLEEQALQQRDRIKEIEYEQKASSNRNLDYRKILVTFFKEEKKMFKYYEENDPIVYDAILAFRKLKQSEYRKLIRNEVDFNGFTYMLEKRFKTKGDFPLLPIKKYYILVPAYFPNYNSTNGLAKLSRDNAIITPTMWNNLTKLQQTNLKKRKDDEMGRRVLSIMENANYKTQRNDLLYGITSTLDPTDIDPIIELVLTKERLIPIIYDIQVKNIRTSVNLGVNSISIFRTDLVNLGENVVMSRSTFINSIFEVYTRLTRTDIVVTFDDFVNSAIKTLTSLYKRDANQNDKAIYRLCLYYGWESPIYRANMGLSSGIVKKSRVTATFGDVASLSIEDIILKHEIHSGGITGFYYLDKSFFKIERILLTKSGNGRSIAQLDQPQTKTNTSYGVVIDYKIKVGACFPKILSEHFKINAIEVKAYKSLWKEVSEKVFNSQTAKQKKVTDPISIEDIKKIADYYQFSVYIHDEDSGNILSNFTLLADSRADSKKKLSTLRVTVKDNHYKHLINYNVKSGEDDIIDDDISLGDEDDANKEDDVNKEEEKIRMSRNYDVFFDFETVNLTNSIGETAGSQTVSSQTASETGIALPYGLSWAIDSNSPQFVCTSQPSYDIIAILFNELLTQFHNIDFSKIEKGKITIFYNLIAYNGRRFDFNLALAYLATHFKPIRSPNMRGKIASFLFKLASRKVNIGGKSYEIVSYVKCKDPNAFISGTMDNAAKSLEINYEKGTLDHNSVQRAYESGKFAEFLEKNYDEIAYYTRMDVQVLRGIHHKLKDLFTELGLDYDNSPTLPSMSEKYWKKLIRERNKVEEEQLTFVPVADPKLDFEIRKTIAGRVCGDVGDFKKSFVLLDIVSLYPSRMKSCSFPYGEEMLANKEDGERIIASNEYVSRFYVDLYQPNKILLGSRKEDGRLDWTDKSRDQKNVFLNSEMIRYLREEGCIVTVVGLGVYWRATTECYSSFVEKFSDLKIEEDRLISEGGGSKSKRTIIKLIMNSLSGKPLQKHYKKETRMWRSGKKTFGEFIAEDGRELVDFHMIGPYSAFAEFSVAEAEWYKRAKPSQLGDFIYSHSRIHMNRLLFSKYHIYYSDTDSAIVDYSNYEDLIKRGVVGNELGKLKLEYKFNRLIVLCPKMYLCLMDNEIVKKSIKGVRESDSWCEKKDGEYKPIESSLIEFFESMLRNKKCYVKTWSFFNDVSNLNIVHRTQTKELKISDIEEKDWKS